jgi:hypothetical protein
MASEETIPSEIKPISVPFFVTYFPKVPLFCLPITLRSVGSTV